MLPLLARTPQLHLFSSPPIPGPISVNDLSSGLNLATDSPSIEGNAVEKSTQCTIRFKIAIRYFVCVHKQRCFKNELLPFPKIVSWRFFKKKSKFNRFNSLHESC